MGGGNSITFPLLVIVFVGLLACKKYWLGGVKSTLKDAVKKFKENNK